MGRKVVPHAAELVKEEVLDLTTNLMHILPKGINVYPIGSAGQKPVSSDADFLLDARESANKFFGRTITETRLNMEQYFKDIGLFSKRTGVIVHVGIPVDRKIIQVDLMVVENAREVAPLHQHDYHDDPNMKGGTIHAIWADLARMVSIPGHSHVMISPYIGLVDRDTKEFITNDKDKIAKILIGPDASSVDLRSVSAIIQSLIPYPEKYHNIYNRYCKQVELV
jgi:hypothetical protein